MTATRQVPLYRVAHSRAGDKGDRSNISVIAWHPEFFEHLVEQVTPDTVRTHFLHRKPGAIACYVMPTLHAINIVIDQVLDGGVNEALNLDSHGKSLSFWMLDMNITIPEELLPLLAGPSDKFFEVAA